MKPTGGRDSIALEDWASSKPYFWGCGLTLRHSTLRALTPIFVFRCVCMQDVRRVWAGGLGCRGGLAVPVAEQGSLSHTLQSPKHRGLITYNAFLGGS